MGVRSRAREQIDILVAKLLLIEVLLHFDEGFTHARLAAEYPGEGVSVTGAVIDVHIDIELL